MARDGAEDVGGETDRAFDHGRGADGEGAVDGRESAESIDLPLVSSMPPVVESSELVADGDAGNENEVGSLRCELGGDDVGSPRADDDVLADGKEGAVGRRRTREPGDGRGGEDGLPAVVVELGAEGAGREIGRGAVAEGLENGRLGRTLTQRVVGTG